jgi:hypothetical protein
MTRLIFLVLLAAMPLRAEVPGGHWYAGIGISGSKPLASDNGHVWSPLQADYGLSLELAFEMTHAFVAIGLEKGGLSSSQPSFDFTSLRIGAIFGSGSVAPYIAGGIGLLQMSMLTPIDMGTETSGSGTAILAEAGILLLREQRFGRIALALRLIAPLFEVPVPYGYYTQGQTNRLPLLLYTMRLFL